jgi:hypothetical protein
MRSQITFTGCKEADWFSREIDESFAGVLAKNYVSDPAKGPVGFTTASIDGRYWHDTMWFRDAGTFLRELVHFGLWDEAKNVFRASLDHVALNEQGYYTFPMYVRANERASGHELDGTATMVIGALLLLERLPAADPFRETITQFLTAPTSPARYVLKVLGERPLVALVAGDGEFGGGCGISGLFYSVVQNALVLWMLEMIGARMNGGETATELRAHCGRAAATLKAELLRRFVAEDGTWHWCLDVNTAQPDHAIINHEINRGFGGLNGVFSYACDVRGLTPLHRPEPWVFPALQTFWKLLSHPRRLKQFQQYGIWTQFDDYMMGYLTGPSYGHGYALQSMLLMDRPELYTKAANWLAWATVEPGYPVTRPSPHWIYERYYSPDAQGRADLEEGCGALNLVNVAEALKVARLMIGLDDHTLDPARIIPRLPAGWTRAEARRLPVRCEGGHVLLDVEIEADASGAVVGVQGTVTGPLPPLHIRLGTAINPRWVAIDAGVLRFDAA